MRTGRRRRLQVSAILAAAGCALGALAACSAGADSRAVSLPLATAAGRSWQWSAACPTGPHAANGCASAGPVLGAFQLAGNEWNLGGAGASSDAVTMSATPTGGLSVAAKLPSAPPCTQASCVAQQANTWVRGFPSVLYGIDQCHAQTSPTYSPKLPLPARVDSIPADLVARAAYTARADDVTHDVAYDLWLNPSSTTRPCKRDGTIEVMVWTDYNSRALLPDSLRVGTASIASVRNGTRDAGVDSWSVYAANVFRAGHTQPWGGTVWIVPNSVSAASAQASAQTVSVDLSAALKAAGSSLQRVFGWRAFARSYWLDTIAFGIEYGPGDADPYGSGPADFSFALNSYCLASGSTPSAASC